MHHVRLIAVFTAVTALSAVAQARLVSQRVDGIERLCVYEKEGPTATIREVVRIGFGEPCPEQKATSERRVARIPIMAQLRRTMTRGSRRVCVYSYSGRNYERTIPINRVCPITP